MAEAAPSTSSTKSLETNLSGVHFEVFRSLDKTQQRERIAKQLAALHEDNYIDDPHALLTLAKNAPKFNETELVLANKKRKITKPEGVSAKRRKSTFELSSRGQKDFAFYHNEYVARLSESEPDVAKGYFAYEMAQPKEPTYPARHLCSVCGLRSTYTCKYCGSKFCRIECYDVHAETRCLRWTA